MKKVMKLFGYVIITSCLLFAGCQTGNPGGPDNPTPVSTNTPVPTNTQAPTNVPTLSPEPTVTNTPTPALFQCRLEGETLVFSGSGCLTREVVDSLLEEMSGQTPEPLAGIRRMVIEEGINGIGATAFSGMPMDEVELPNSLKEIGYGAFMGCENLKQIKLPDGVIILEASAFKNCTNLVEVVVSKAPDSIGGDVFRGCTALQSVQLPEGMLTIESGMFNNCNSLEHIVIPEGVTRIGEAAFAGCNSLVTVTIPDSVTVIEKNAFRECIGLQGIELPQKMTEIGFYAFKGCSNLKSIVIPEGVPCIGPETFSGCSSMAGIAIPESVEDIFDSAVYKNCPKVTLYCVSGTYAAQYAQENNLDYFEIEKTFWSGNRVLPEEKLTLQQKIELSGGIINVGGEECNAVWGETGALAWKYVEATFDERAYYATSFAIDASDMPGHGAWDAMRVFNWHKWYGWDEFNIEHIGDDMFLFTGKAYDQYTYYYINGSGGITFEERSWLSDADDSFYRSTDFNDGYAMGVYRNKYQTYWYGYLKNNTEYKIAALDEYGNMKESDIVIDETTYILEDLRPGLYSDGVFYFNNAFYDIEFNEVLNLRNKDWGRIYEEEYGYRPYFQDGVCTLITLKNGKYWKFDINKEGEMISEAEEFDLSNFWKAQ